MPLHRADSNDWYTAAAIGLAAMCLVTFDHEALGHGGTCLAMGGHIQVLSNSIFRCSIHSVWIDPAGPCANVLAGAISFMVASRVPSRFIAARLFLALITSFSFFWEEGYLVKAMIGRNGDLYFAASDFLGEPSLWWRITGTAVGVIAYLVTARWVSRALIGLLPNDNMARRAARVVWIAATLGAALATLAHTGGGNSGLKDAVLEIGAASVPLLFIAPMSQTGTAASSPVTIHRSWTVICLSLAIYAVFVATLGRGLTF